MKQSQLLTFLLLLSILISCDIKESTQSGSLPSKYFPENCWGVYSWSNWNTELVTPESHPLIKGAPIVLKWNEVEPEPGKFMFTEEINKKLQLAEKQGFYTFLMVWVAPNAPRWLYDNGVPELKMTPTLNPLGEPRDWTFQYYLDDDYIFYYHRMLKEFGSYLTQLPENLRKRILYVQSAEGSTGDGGPYKGTPLQEEYDISMEEWGEFRIEAWEVLKNALSNEKGELVIPILVNYDSNNERHYNWLLDNFSVIGLKNGMFSHGYHISNTKERIENWKKFKNDCNSRGIEFFSRGEQDGEWAVYGWSTQNPAQAFYWSGIFATHCGLDMWNVPYKASAGYQFRDAIEFFNKYAGHHEAASSPAAFCALRKGLDASDTASYPEALFGKAEKKNVQRYLNIAAAFHENGAFQGDPDKAIGGGMVNRKRQDYNDVGWGIYDGNYERNISQIDPEITSTGWWHKGPEKSIYSRFARSIKTIDGNGAIFFDVDDEFLNKPTLLEIRIVWLDEGRANWTLRYDSKSDPQKEAVSIQNENSGEWKEIKVKIKDAKFGNRGKKHSDFIIETFGADDAVFHLIEITKIYAVKK